MNKARKKLQRYLETGLMKKSVLGSFSLDEIADAYDEYKNEAYKALGYKTRNSLDSLLDRNIDIKREWGQKWYDILNSNEAQTKLILGIGIDDTGDKHTNKGKIQPYFSTYKYMLKSKKTVCDDWVNSLSSFRNWYLENHTTGARLQTDKSNHYSPETASFSK